MCAPSQTLPSHDDVTSRPASSADPSTYELVVSDDGLEARLDLPDPARLPGLLGLETALLAEHGLSHVDRDILESSLEAARHGAVTEVVVARGVAPQAGTDGGIEWLGEFFASHAIVFPDGSVDHYHHSSRSAYPGQSLLKILSPTPGVSGLDVRGKVLPAEPGHPVEMAPDPETVCRDPESEDRLIAVIGGVVEWVPPRLSISNLLELDRVDFESGSVQFEGAVRIAGEIKDNFDVWARGSVEVGGFVGACDVVSGAQLTLAQPVVGRDRRGRLESGGDLVLTSARSVRIICRRNLVAATECLSCETQVEGDLLAETGRIVGGTHQVVGSVVADVIGSVGQVRTTLHLGTPPLDRRRVHRVRRQHQKVRDQIQELVRDNPLAFSSGERDERSTRVRQRLAAYKVEEKRLGEVEERVTAEVEAARLRRSAWVKSRIHAGTRIWFEGCSEPFKVTQDIPGPVRVQLDPETGRIVCQNG